MSLSYQDPGSACVEAVYAHARGGGDYWVGRFK